MTKSLMIKSILCFSITIYSLHNSANAQVKGTLDAKQESIVTIAAFTANGDLSKLEHALNEGLDAKLSVSEIKEVIVQMYAYAGFPRCLNALHTFMDLLKERKEKGIKDIEGKNASPYPSNKPSIEFGTDNQTRLVGKPVKGEVMTLRQLLISF